MKKVYRLPIIFLLMTICVTIFSCSGSVGNTKEASTSLSNLSTIEPPIMNYRLINDESEYELVSIEDGYFGAFLVEFYYSNPENNDYLPVTSIASEALKDRYSVLFIIIANNIEHIGRDAFSGWRSYQSIFFEISEEESQSRYYDFDEGWNNNCQANITWNVDLESFSVGWQTSES